MSSYVSPLQRAPRLSLDRIAYAVLLMAAATGPVYAQNSTPTQSGRQTESASGRPIAAAQLFEITGVDLENQAGLDEGHLQQVRALFDAILGKGRTVADVTGARLSAQALLDKSAPGTLAVNIPEQTLVGGRVKVLVNRTQKARIGVVQAVGTTTGFSAENVRAGVPALKEGTELDPTALDTQLRLGELNPFKRTNVTLGMQPNGTPAAIVNASAERSQLVYLTTDNYGPGGARARFGAGYLNANTSGRDDVLSLNYVTASDPQRLKGLSASYALPLYGYGQMLEFSAARSESDSADTVELFHLNGTGTSASLKWSYLLPRFGSANLRLTAGYLYHRTENNVTFNALAGYGSLVPSGSTAPLSVGIEGEIRPIGQPILVTGGVNLSHNFAGKLGSTDEAGLSSIRQGAGDFTLLSTRVRVDAEVARGWQLRASLQGQFTSDTLTGADQLNIAGPYAVRGFREAGVLGDRALVMNAEAATPVLATFSGVALRGWSFLDYGTMHRNGSLVGELSSASLSSAGLGLRATANWGTVELYAARKLSGEAYDADKSRNSIWVNALLRF